MRKWLPYFEAVVLIALIVLIILNTKRGGAEISSPPASQADALIEQGDEYFAKQYLPKALFAYWEGIQAIEADTHNANHASLCLLYTSPSPRDRTRSRMPSSA